MCTNKTRRGFALTELVLLLVLLAMLLSMFIPALFRSRASARRNACINNLKQLALSLHNYHDVYKKFPVISRDEVLTQQIAGSTEDKTREDFSWVVRILPYIEEGALYNEISRQSERFKQPAFDPAYSVAGAHFATFDIATLQCPEYAGPARSTAKEYDTFKTDAAKKPQPKQPESGVAIGNYAALTATHLALVSASPTKANGIIVPGKAATMATVRDGTSKTILLTESREEAYSAWYGSTGTWVVGLPTAAMDPEPNAEKILSIKENTPAPVNYGPSMDDKERVYLAKDKWANAGPRAWGPSSQHSGVAVHAFADGAVRAVAADISPDTYIWLITRDGGEGMDFDQIEGLNAR
jgi:type II secretory pathway pseudopilin PulG